VTFEQLLVKYLYQHKQLSLQGYGTVTLKSSVPDAEMIHKNRQIPIEGISFDYNMKALTDEEFVLFYSQQRGKIKPLAVSDIESHLQLAKQLMNIGKPYEIEGLGIFAMQNNGNVVLHPGNYTVLSTDTSPHPGRLKERTEHQEKTEADASGSGLGAGVRKGLLVVGILLALGAAGWFIWSKFVSDKQDNSVVVPTVDSLQQQNAVTPVQDSIAQQPVQPVVTDTTKWRAYFRSFTGKERINTMLRLYEKHNPLLETTDSTLFKLYVVVNSPLADTASKIDSLSKVFLRPVTLEKIIQ
jgi:hypothetical protein